MALSILTFEPATMAVAAQGGGLQRVGVPDGLVTNPPLQAHKVKLGTATRNAFEVAEDFAFEVVPEGGCRRLIVSTGIAAEESSIGRIEFSIEVGESETRRRIFATTVSSDTPGWRDAVVTLDTPAAPGETLRFTTVGRTAGGGSARPYWGSILIQPLAAEEDTGTALRGRSAPNVIMISLDTLGAKHVGWYGRQPSVSPALDEFLGRSFTFRRAYAQYPNTLVSHASLFSGLYPNRHHVYGNAATLRSETLASILAASGYVTVGITEDAYVSSDFGFDRGFDWYDDGQHVIDQFPGTARKTFDKATDWLGQFGSQAPFFLFVHTYEVHTPYLPRDEIARQTLERLSPGYTGPFREMYPGGELEVKHNRGIEPISRPDIERLVALHESEIRYLDEIFGQFTKAVAGFPFAQDTLVVVVSDHGDEFNEHGRIGHGETLYNPVLHVPLAFFWPGRVRAGAEETRVQLIDVAPTILDLIGIAQPSSARFDGQTLEPAIRGQGDANITRPVFAELRSAWASCRELGLPDDCRSEHYAAQTERFKYLTSMIPWREELYDLQTDPGEQSNVAGDHPEELLRFRRLLADYVIGAAAAPDALQPADERVDAGGESGRGLDDATRERLKALGYNP